MGRCERGLAASVCRCVFVCECVCSIHPSYCLAVLSHITKQHNQDFSEDMRSNCYDNLGGDNTV